VIDFRLYRAGFLPALVSVVVALFALQVPPAPLPPVVAPAEFDQVAAAKIARQIVDQAPVRTPGSAGDATIAELVEKRFKAVRDGQVAEQRFTSSLDGREVNLRNLILTLPGESPRSIVVLAPRDSASGPGAASSAAATATLLELVDELDTSGRTKTLIFVSTDGSSDGALGAREFAAHFPQRDLIDGAIVLWQTGSANRRPPALLDTSDGPQSASAGLVRTAERALADQAGTKSQTQGVFGELASLALPSGLGDQAVLIEQGIDAVGLSSAGERPLPAPQDQPADLSTATLGDFGRTALLLAATLDAAPGASEHGPDAYVQLSGNLVPGWALGLLAVTLLLPAAIAALDAVARALRRRGRVGWGLWWSASRGLPPFGALLLLYLLALTGIVTRPRFPFDPSSFRVGAGEIVVMVVLAGALAAGFYALRGWRVPAGLRADAAVAALGIISTLAVFVAWLANPYLALLLVPAAHVWLLDARERPVPWPAALGAALLSLIPFAAAVGDLIGRLGLGSTAPWQLLLMVADGQIGFGEMFALCLLIGALVGVVALAARRRSPAPPTATSAPPGPVGVLSASPPEDELAAVDRLDASTISRSRGTDDLEEGTWTR
jgi:Peptidase family M28